MATRRMFSNHIVDTDAFLDMPDSSQLLYFHLAMRADDEGFVGSPKKIMRMCGFQDDNLKVLIAKRFILTFENGVVVIKHWLIHNTIRMDRFHETTYQKEKKALKISKNKAYSEKWQPNGNQRLPQVKLSKVKLSKDKLTSAKQGFADGKTIANMIKLFESVNPSYQKLFANKTQRAAISRLLKNFAPKKLAAIIETLPTSNADRYAPEVTTPCQLEDKIGRLKLFWDKRKNNQKHYE